MQGMNFNKIYVTFKLLYLSVNYANKAVKLQPQLETQVLKLECLLTKRDYKNLYNSSDELMRTGYDTEYKILKYKAISSYFLGNYEEALKLYHKGYRLAPKHRLEEFRHGIRRTEEDTLAILDKKSRLLFDLNNPIFCDKNVFHENYSNLRRHLYPNRSQDKDFSDSLDVPVVRNPQIQNYVNIWMLKSVKRRRRTNTMMDAEK